MLLKWLDYRKNTSLRTDGEARQYLRFKRRMTGRNFILILLSKGHGGRMLLESKVKSSERVNTLSGALLPQVLQTLGTSVLKHACL